MVFCLSTFPIYSSQSPILGRLLPCPMALRRRGLGWEIGAGLGSGRPSRISRPDLGRRCLSTGVATSATVPTPRRPLPTTVLGPNLRCPISSGPAHVLLPHCSSTSPRRPCALMVLPAPPPTLSLPVVYHPSRSCPDVGLSNRTRDSDGKRDSKGQVVVVREVVRSQKIPTKRKTLRRGFSREQRLRER